jgi:hypothetical protein
VAEGDAGILRHGCANNADSADRNMIHINARTLRRGGKRCWRLT